VPKRSDIRCVFVIGSGPIVIGQACEFDYSGTQAVKALKEEGLRVVLLNSNPATVMTDPELADRTYIEPITREVAERIIECERPDALLPTMGGQTALNLARELGAAGVLEKHGVRLIGAQLEAIDKAEDRLLFKAAMERIGLETPKSEYVRSLVEAKAAAQRLGFPLVVRPSFTLAGTGGGIARDAQQFEQICAEGLRASPVGSLLIEESVLGWKEFELEVVRDRNDNAIVVCSIENLDPMGVHTGDSITVAPAQTLTDREYQRMRQAALAILREIGVETGGSNVQFAVDPKNGRMVVIEMNPRVSRSSALASKATGYPIAKVAAKLAIGFCLDELKNDITQDTPASFEPALDYVVVKVPRFNFEKFPHADPSLGTSMRSVGEVMALGRTFEEAYFKAMRSIELGRPAVEPAPQGPLAPELLAGLGHPTPERPWQVLEALRRRVPVADVAVRTGWDPWFVHRLEDVVRLVERVEAGSRDTADLSAWVRCGLGEAELARLAPGVNPGVRRVFKRVDTCAAEFESHTPFLYSTWESEDEVPQQSAQPRILILGSGPIRIGQGIEFDYCCVEASVALRAAGYETVMVNCNPETVSTDWDTSSRLYFEPLTVDDVLAIAARERPVGAIVQFGGQTPLKLSRELERRGLKVLGTTPDAIHRAEDREEFAQLLDELGLKQADWGIARDVNEARHVASRLGYPVMVRPSYVLGGRAMEIARDEASLLRFAERAFLVSPGHPVLVDRFLEAAIEVDLDLVADRAGEVMIGGVLEHVQEAGIHSGDAACSLPPHSLSRFIVEELKEQARAVARALGVVGLMNVQFAIQGSQIFILEVNPRASRTVPFVSKATGVPLARIAALCMAGRTLAELGAVEPDSYGHVAVKESVFPFSRFPGVDVLLGPEMKSTGEVMGLADDFATAFAKAQLAAGMKLPTSGAAFLSVHQNHKQHLVSLASRLAALGFELFATEGTAIYLKSAGLNVERVNKVREGSPHAVDLIRSGKVSLLFNTTQGERSIADSFSMRREALMHSVPYYTTLEAARIVVDAIEVLAKGPLPVSSLQERLR
jgi:carbamoyl-phosphate synthase large subunit